MKTTKQLSLILITLLLVVSCAKMPMHETESVTKKSANSKLRFYSQKIKYDVFNDETYIYVNVIASDLATQYKILNLGFTLWFDQKGKKKTTIGIVFPQKQPGADEFKRDRKNSSTQDDNGQNQNTQQLERLQKQFELTSQLINLVGFKDKNSSEMVDPTTNSYGINVQITFDKDHQLHYEAKIPIKQIFTDPKYADSTFSIGLESGFIQMDYSSGPPQSGGGRGDGMRGGPGGGSGGGRGGGGKGGGGGLPEGNGENTQQRSELTTPVEAWFKVRIAP